MQRWASIAVTSLLLMGAETLEAGFWDWIGWKEEVPMEPGVNQVEARVIQGQALQQKRNTEKGDSVGRRATKPASEKRRTRRVQKEQPFPWEKQDSADAPLPWETPEQHQAPKESVRQRQEKVQQGTVKKATAPIKKDTAKKDTAKASLLSTPNQCTQPVQICDSWDVSRPCASTCSSLNSPYWLRHGVFMPSCKPLFPEFLADPRAIILSAGWRFNDDCFANNMVDVSYGQSFPFYRWHNVFCCGDALQLDVQGALWALFDHLNESAPLVNADYYVGFPLTWACGRWQARLRGYHISSHIGDEYLIMNPNFDRRNPSAEYLDFFLAFKPNPDIRFYGGYGYVLHRDNSFRVHHNYFEWGMETYMPMLRWNLWQHRVLGQPFFAMHFRGREEDHWREDSTFVLGYEFKKYAGCGGRLRFFFQYHNGTSLEGQFSRNNTDYLSFRVSYAY